MKRFLPKLTGLVVFLFVLMAYSPGWSQALLTENFDYAAGALLTANGWTAHSGSGTQAVDVVVPGLSFTGYSLSGIGGAAQLDNTGEDLHKTFTAQTTGTLYLATMVKVVTPAEGYFLHLGGNPISTIFRSKVFVLGSADPFNFGLSVGSNTGTAISGGSFAAGTTYLLVLKYQINEGTNNDAVSLFVFSGAIPGTEPATPSVGPLTDSGQTDIIPASVALRQYVASQNIQVDGIRVATSWAGAVGGAVGPDVTPPLFASGYPKLSNVNSTSANVEISLDEAGKAYYVVVPDGAAAPTVAQVVAGINYGGVTLVTKGTAILAAGGAVATVNLTGLTDKTNYDVYVVAEDDEATPNRQVAAVKLDLYTQRALDVIFSSDFTTSLEPFKQVSVTGDQLWEKREFGGNGYAYLNGYSGGANNENLDWLISPAIQLDSSDLNTLSFMTAANYTGPAIKVKISSNFTGNYTVQGVNAATWTDITSSFSYSSTGYAWVASGNFSLAAYSGKVYVAFIYESSTTSGAAWEVDDVKVTGFKRKTNSNLIEEGIVQFYPVPARSQLVLENMEKVSRAEVFDLSGKLRIVDEANGEFRRVIPIGHLSPGIYVIRFVSPTGLQTGKFVKE